MRYTDPNLLVVAQSRAGAEGGTVEIIDSESGVAMTSSLAGAYYSLKSIEPAVTWCGHRTLRDPTQATNPATPPNAPTSVRMQLYLGFGQSGAVYRYMRDGAVMLMGHIAGAGEIADAMLYLPNTKNALVADRGSGTVKRMKRDAAIAAKPEKWSFEDSSLWEITELFQLPDVVAVKTADSGTVYAASTAGDMILRVPMVDAHDLTVGTPSVHCTIPAPLAMDIDADETLSVLCADGLVRLVLADGSIEVSPQFSARPTTRGTVSVDRYGTVGARGKAYVVRDDEAPFSGAAGVYCHPDQGVLLLHRTDGLPRIARALP